MDPLTLAMLGIGVASTIGGVVGQRKAEQRQEKSNREMMALQQKYNLENWQRQNAYNNPAAAMQRLRDAGLNPHLLYGQGVAGATGQAGDVGSVSSHQTKYGNRMDNMQYFSDWTTQAQNLSNLRSTNDLRSAQQMEANSRTANNTYDLQLKKLLEETNIDAAKENLRKQKIENQSSQIDYNIKAQTEKSQIEYLVQQAEIAKNATEQKKLENDILKAKKEYWDQGIAPPTSFQDYLYKEYGKKVLDWIMDIGNKIYGAGADLMF